MFSVGTTKTPPSDCPAASCTLVSSHCLSPSMHKFLIGCSSGRFSFSDLFFSSSILFFVVLSFVFFTCVFLVQSNQRKSHFVFRRMAFDVCVGLSNADSTPILGPLWVLFVIVGEGLTPWKWFSTDTDISVADFVIKTPPIRFPVGVRCSDKRMSGQQKFICKNTGIGGPVLELCSSRAAHLCVRVLLAMAGFEEPGWVWRSFRPSWRVENPHEKSETYRLCSFW